MMSVTPRTAKATPEPAMPSTPEAAKAVPSTPDVSRPPCAAHIVPCEEEKVCACSFCEKFFDDYSPKKCSATNRFELPDGKVLEPVYYCQKCYDEGFTNTLCCGPYLTAEHVSEHGTLFDGMCICPWCIEEEDEKLCELAPPTDPKVEQKRREEVKARRNALKDKIESTKLTDERKKELLKMLEEDVSSYNDMVNTLYRVQGKLRCYLDYLNAPQRPKKRPRAASEEPKQTKQAKRSLYDTLKRTLSADAPQEDERLRVPTIPTEDQCRVPEKCLEKCLETSA